jgi:hypothetical protein
MSKNQSGILLNVTFLYKRNATFIERRRRMNWVNDIGAPVAVTVIDLAVESTAPEWNEWASYIVCVGGWLAQTMGWVRGDFSKNMAIAATPWAAKNVYQRVRGAVGSPVRKLSTTKVSRWPAPLVEEPFGGARMV